MKHWLLIPLWCVAAAVGYGVVHDLVTAQVCVEYFTIGHPILIDTENPVVLALLWGVVATWWAGLIIAVPLTLAARLGRDRPAWGVGRLVKPVLVLLACMFCLAMIALVVGYVLARRDIVFVTGRLAEFLPRASHDRFLADAFAHNASYAGGFVGGIILSIWVWVRRGREDWA